MAESFRILHLTDLHLVAGAKERYRGLDTRLHLQAALQEAAQQPPDLVILTGDLAQDESLTTYQWLAAQLESRGWAWCWLPGNHDNPRLMAEIAAPTFSRQHLGWQLLGLNTHLPGQASGYLSPSELDRVRQVAALDQPLLIAMHHHPLAAQNRWMDALALQNRDDFWLALARLSQPLVVICGHIHHERVWRHPQGYVYATPATAVQFAPDSDDFKLDEAALPAMRWLELQASATWKTQVHRFSI